VRQHHGADTVMLVLPADHLIEPQSEFARAVASARHAAEQGSIVTFGIKPTGPETGYGYIEYERGSELAPGVHKVRRFVEKPKLEVARQLVDSGDYLWNSGMFCFTAGTILAEIAAFAPDVLAQTDKAVQSGALVDGSDNSCLELDEAAFAQVRSISVDYAVMEKSSRVAVVPSSMQWSDIGSWTSLSELLAPDAQGNRLQGQVLVHASTNCYADSPHRVLGVVGVSNLVIVDTPDALLVADASQVQEVKQIVAQLKEQRHEAAKFHRYAEHAWGSSTMIDATGQFETRRVIINAGAVWQGERNDAMLLQLMVLRGKGELITAAGSVTVDPLHCASVDPARHHEVHNATRDELVLLAIQHRAAPAATVAAAPARAAAR
jgi:mannose-1-phosphate guanylyltransferase